MIEAPSLLLALFAGVISFLSPCVLPLVPAYIGYMSGSAVAAVSAGSPAAGTTTTGTSSSTVRWVVVGHALLFVFGLTLVFVVVIGGLAGAFSVSLMGQRAVLQRVMGVMLVIFGLHSIGVINIPFLNYTRRLDIRPAAGLGYLRSFLIGMGFAIGWTPCIGPTLGLIFTMAANDRVSQQAYLPALAYSLGLGIPFLLAALAMGQISAGLKRLTRRSYSLKVGRFTIIEQVNVISLVSGILLIMMGLLTYTNALTLLTRIAPNFGI